MAYQRGTGFVGLQQYLSANQEVAQRMGQGLAQQVNAEGQAATGAIDAGAQAFDQQAAAGTPTYTGLPDSQNLPGTADLYLYNKMQDATYKGPKTLGDVADVGALKAQAQKAGQTAQLAGTDAGRATLLAKGAQGQYGLGARTLDAYLAGRGGGEALQQATSKYQGLQEYLGTAEKKATTRAAQGATDASGVAEQYRNTKVPTLTYGSAPQVPPAPVRRPLPGRAPPKKGRTQ